MSSSSYKSHFLNYQFITEFFQCILMSMSYSPIAISLKGSRPDKLNAQRCSSQTLHQNLPQGPPHPTTIPQYGCGVGCSLVTRSGPALGFPPVQANSSIRKQCNACFRRISLSLSLSDLTSKRTLLTHIDLKNRTVV